MRSCSRSDAGVGVTVRFGLIGVAAGAVAVWNLAISPQPASPSGAHSKNVAAQRRRLIPLLRRPANPSTSATHSFGVLVPAAQHFNLPRVVHFNPRARSRLHPATNPNPPIL